MFRATSLLSGRNAWLEFTVPRLLKRQGEGHLYHFWNTIPGSKLTGNFRLKNRENVEERKSAL